MSPSPQDPSDAVREQLRQELLRLTDTRPQVLMMYPSLDDHPDQPPYKIWLVAHAQDVAAVLHERFGEFVRLRVGALPYPPLRDAPRIRGKTTDVPEMDASEFGTALDGPLSISSGHSVTHTLLFTNLTDEPVGVRTNGKLTARIVDPSSGSIVGGFAGMQHAPLVIFRAAPTATVPIPLLVGTASFDPDLGYTVPPGDWTLVAPIRLADGRELITPRFALTVVQ